MSITTKLQQQTNNLSKQELAYLLKTMSEIKFEGKDILIVHSVVTKLQKQLDEKA